MLKRMSIVFIAGLIIGFAPRFLSADNSTVNIKSATVTSSVINR